MAQEIVDGVVYDVVRIQNPGAGGGGGGEVTTPDGGDATVGSKADAPAVDPTAENSLISLTKTSTSAQLDLSKTVGAKNPGTAAASSLAVGGVYSGSTTTLTPGQQAAHQFDNNANLKTTLGTKLAGENTSRNYLEVRSGQGDRWSAEAGITTTLGTVGATGDFLERLDVTVTDSSKSGIVLIDGTVAAVLSLTTNDTTASTTTVINTAVNPAAVSADQYRGALLKIGTEYRRIGPHAAFAAGAVNQYTVTRAFSTAPGLSAAFTIEDKRYTFQIASSGVLVSGQRLPVQYLAKQGALRLIPETGVHCAAFGDFT